MENQDKQNNVCLRDHSRIRDIGAHSGWQNTWDTFVTIFAKKNDMMLQRLENELFLISERDKTIAQYFYRFKSICRKIIELNLKSVIEEAQMKIIFIHKLWLEYRNFVIAIQLWPPQPSFVEFEILLVSQEAMIKQETHHVEEWRKVFYTSKSRSNNKMRWYKMEQMKKLPMNRTTWRA